MDKVHFETSGSLGILTLSNPPLNLLSGELLEDLRTAVNEVKRAPLRALLLRAEGKVFSAGADVSAFSGRTEDEARERFTSNRQMIADLEELPFPTLAAVQGICVRGRAGAGARMRSHLGGCLRPLRPAGGDDRDHDTAGRRATPG